MTIGVVIPAYKVQDHVLDVIARIGPECEHIFVVDDCCPYQSGDVVKINCSDPRVRIIYNPVNLGVGGAVIAGYRAAIKAGCSVIVKVDGDGQMAPELIPLFTQPILDGIADYTKGNRFFNLDKITEMPAIRLFGNSVLSFMSKFSSGYWSIFDPTNGYTAIHANVAQFLPFEKISERYFFESDMLFRLNTMRCVVVDIPMDAHYADEESSLNIKRVVVEFFAKHSRNFVKRIFYNYFLRDFSVATFELVFGLILILFGFGFGIWHWRESSIAGSPSTAGTVMLAAVPLTVGLQLLLAFLAYDIQSQPSTPIHRRLLNLPHRI